MWIRLPFPSNGIRSWVLLISFCFGLFHLMLILRLFGIRGFPGFQEFKWTASRSGKKVLAQWGHSASPPSTILKFSNNILSRFGGSIGERLLSFSSIVLFCFLSCFLTKESCCINSGVGFGRGTLSVSGLFNSSKFQSSLHSSKWVIILSTEYSSSLIFKL